MGKWVGGLSMGYRRWAGRRIVALLFGLLPVGPIAAQQSALFQEIRVGDHGKSTRLVVDFARKAPSFASYLSQDGTVLTLVFQAEAAKKSAMKWSSGLLRDMQMQSEDGKLRLIVGSRGPLAIAAQSALAPSAAYRHYRVYFDLVAAGAESPRAEMNVAAMPEPVAVPMMAPEPNSHAAMSSHPSNAEAAHGEEHERHEEEEATASVKLGAVGERGIHGGPISAGPYGAIQTGIFHEALEIEAGVSPLFAKGERAWNSGLTLKKPFELSERLEFEIGGGPHWIRKTEGDNQGNHFAGEAVIELIYWPNDAKNFGFYTESSYSREFSKGHESAVGVAGGLLIAVP